MSSRDWSALGLLLIVAAGVRAYAWHQTAVLFNDGPIFLAMAEAIEEGRWGAVASHPFHPLYPACIAAVRSALPVGLETAAIVVSIFGGLLSVAGVFGLAPGSLRSRDRLDGRRGGDASSLGG